MSDPRTQAEAIRGLLKAHRATEPVDSIGEAVLACCNLLIQAGEAAVAEGLVAEAQATFGSGDASWSLRALIARSRALVVSGRRQEAIDQISRFESDIDGDDSLLSSTEWMEALVWKGAALWQLNRVQDATGLLVEVRNRLLQKPDSRALAWCAYHLASSMLVSGDRASAHRLSLDTLVSARRTSERYVEALALRLLGILDTSRCRWSAAHDSSTECIQIAQAASLSLILVYSLRGLGVIQWKRGHLVDALERATEASTRATALSNDYQRCYADLLVAIIQLHRGKVDECRSTLGACSESLEPTPLERSALLATEYLGDTYLEQGQAEEALSHYDQVWPKAMALVPKGDIVAELRRRRAECHYLLGRFEDAHREALAGLDHCRELGDRYEEAATYRVLALSTAALGRPADAKKWFDQGFAYYDDIETPYEWGKLWMAYGDWLKGPHAGEFADAGAALEAYQAAADHFERMGAQAKLEEANARIMAMTPQSPPTATTPASAPADAVRPRRPARRPRAAIELERRSNWAGETFGFITRDPSVLTLLEEVAKLARSDAPILVLGESGTGKELVASGIHRLSTRAGLFVPINCGAIPRDMIESELFGHVAGAFTGAMRDKPGIIETCDGGTVFLDEIGEMSQDLQARLLRFLERSEARRVGANRNYSVDTRVVAATNRDRMALERGEGFRPDLYYRLAHAVITLPPLRRRGDDLELLVDRFMAEFCAAEGREVSLSDAARSRLMRHSWPGNVRQLRAVLRRVVLLGTPGHTVEPEQLQLDDGFAPATLTEELGQAEKARIVQALASAQGSRTLAAKALGMPRTTLITRMQRYGLM